MLLLLWKFLGFLLPLLPQTDPLYDPLPLLAPLLISNILSIGCIIALFPFSGCLVHTNLIASDNSSASCEILSDPWPSRTISEKSYNDSYVLACIVDFL